MTMNTVQFQKGLSMTEFVSRYSSQEQCERAVIEWRWPSGYVCVACSSRRSLSFRCQTLLYWECSDCGHQCSLISGTVFESTKLALTRWFWAMHLLTRTKNGTSALELKRDLGVCYETALLLKHKVMEVMRLREEPRQLTAVGSKWTTPTLVGSGPAASQGAARRTKSRSWLRCRPPKTGRPS